jgi:hypothetical protein
MHLQAVIPFPQEKGKSFALTTEDLLNSIAQCQHTIKSDGS